MPKFIQLINLDEIKALRITCGKCHAYWSVPMPLEDNELPNKCNYCKTEKGKDVVIPFPTVERLKKLLEEIEWAQNKLENCNFKISIELETEKGKPPEE